MVTKHLAIGLVLLGLGALITPQLLAADESEPRTDEAYGFSLVSADATDRVVEESHTHGRLCPGGEPEPPPGYYYVKCIQNGGIYYAIFYPHEEGQLPIMEPC